MSCLSFKFSTHVVTTQHPVGMEHLVSSKQGNDKGKSDEAPKCVVAAKKEQQSKEERSKARRNKSKYDIYGYTVNGVVLFSNLRD